MIAEPNHLTCSDVEQQLCDRVKPGEFTVLPEEVRQHLDACDACQEFFEDLILLAGQLSRYGKLAEASEQAGTLPKHDATPSQKPDPVATLTVQESRRDMLDDHDTRVNSQLPTVRPNMFPVHGPAQVPMVTSSSAPRRSRTKIIAFAVSALIAACVAIAYLHPFTPVAQGRHVALTEMAGKAFEAGKFPDAIARAKECVDDFEPAAMRLQEQLQTAGLDLPVGRVDASTRDRLLSNGPLNDVGACYFYLGQAHRKLGQMEEARKAYEIGAKFTNARVYDPRQDIFWAPADDCAYWAKKLNPTTQG